MQDLLVLVDFGAKNPDKLTLLKKMMQLQRKKHYVQFFRSACPQLLVKAHSKWTGSLSENGFIRSRNLFIDEMKRVKMKKRGVDVSATKSIINQKRFSINVITIILQFLNWKESMKIRMLNKKFKEAYERHLLGLQQFGQRNIYQGHKTEQVEEYKRELADLHKIMTSGANVQLD